MPVLHQPTKRPASCRRTCPKRAPVDRPRPAARRVIVVGVSEKARSLAETLCASTHPPYQIVGYLEEDGADGRREPDVLGSASELLEIAERMDVDEVIVASVPGWMERLAEKISISDNGRPKIRLVPSVYEAMVCYPKLARVNDLPLMTLGGDRPTYARFAKRLFDIAFSSVALAAIAPIVAVSAVLMKLTSRGAVLYRQARVGRGGKEFTLLKLRTMVADAEADTGPVLSGPTDGRVTIVGRVLRRLKIDEMPQFWNVMRGEMSVVGPRPERRCFVEQFSQSIPGYGARHRVKPGITGLAQIYGGYKTDPDTKLRYDLLYVYGGSLWADLTILALTLPAVIRGA